MAGCLAVHSFSRDIAQHLRPRLGYYPKGVHEVISILRHCSTRHSIEQLYQPHSLILHLSLLLIRGDCLRQQRIAFSVLWISDYVSCLDGIADATATHDICLSLLDPKCLHACSKVFCTDTDGTWLNGISRCISRHGLKSMWNSLFSILDNDPVTHVIKYISIISDNWMLFIMSDNNSVELIVQLFLWTQIVSEDVRNRLLLKCIWMAGRMSCKTYKAASELYVTV